VHHRRRGGCDDDGRPSFDASAIGGTTPASSYTPSDLIELNGDDLRRDPLEVRKAMLASVLAKAGSGLRLNDHLKHEDGEVVFRHACKLGLEGIVSKRKGSPYRSGRSPDWLKLKNPEAPAVKRETEEEWGKAILALRGSFLTRRSRVRDRCARHRADAAKIGKKAAPAWPAGPSLTRGRVHPPRAGNLVALMMRAPPHLGEIGRTD
jgi:hypothetical protein